MSTPDLTIEALRGMIEGLMNDTLRFSDPKSFYGTGSVWVPTLWYEGRTTDPKAGMVTNPNPQMQSDFWVWYTNGDKATATPTHYCVCGGEWSGGGQCRQCGARR